MKAVILVGGFGTRLRPLTLHTKKELMPVAGRPFLEHTLARLAYHGVDEAILTTGYLAEAFEDFPSERKHGVALNLVREDEPLDTGGAIRNAVQGLDETFLVLNGDILTDLDLGAMIEFHRSSGGVGTIALTPVDDPSAYGLVPTDDDGRITRFIEKPRADEIVTNMINAGTYVLEPEAFDAAPASRVFSIERKLFPALVERGTIFGFADHGYWLDIGTPAKYLQANHDVLQRRVGETPPGIRTEDGVWVGGEEDIDATAVLRGPSVVGEDCRVAPGAVIDAFSALGDRCVVEAGASVDASVVQDGVRIGSEARVERCVLAAGAEVGARTKLADCVVGPGVCVGADNEIHGHRLWPGIAIPGATMRA